ncbi:MAG: PTS sugar transporter subunit IIA [Romboutsia sp.]
MLTKKESIIIKHLSENKGYTTASELGNILGVSTKTIKRAISNINQYLKGFNVNIVSSRGVGYTLEGSKKDISRLSSKAQNMINGLIEEDSLENRIDSTICLLINNDYISIEEISEELKLSLASINKLLAQVKKILLDYELNIKSKPCYGSYIVGKEDNLRKLMIDYCVKINGSEKLNSQIDNVYTKEIDIIESIIINTLKSKDIIISDKDFNIFLSKIIISVSRSRRNKKYLGLQEINKLEENKILLNIITEVSGELNIKFDNGEIEYICSYSSFLEEINIDSKIKDIIKSSLDDIYLISGTDYKKDKEFINTVCVHIKRVIGRAVDKLKIENPLSYQIKKNFPIEFNLATFISKKIEKEFDIVINEDEMCYIAIHFATSSEKLKRVKVKNICIICHYGIGTGQLIAEKIRQTMSDVNIVGVYPVKYLDMGIKENIDIVISTVELKDINKQVVYVNNIFSDDMIESIKSGINSGEERKKILVSMFDEDAIFKIDAKNKEEAINLIGKTMIDKELISYKSLESIIEREYKGSTETGNLVAIPHTIVDEDESSIIGVGILENPIIWDKQEVQLIFMVFLNKNEKQNAPIFRHLYNFVKDIGGVKSVISFCDFNKIMDAIS